MEKVIQKTKEVAGGELSHEELSHEELSQRLTNVEKKLKEYLDNKNMESDEEVAWYVKYFKKNIYLRALLHIAHQRDLHRMKF
jgi:hypothetical protein